MCHHQSLKYFVAGQPARNEAELAAAERADHEARVLRDGAGARPRPVGGHTPSQVRICLPIY